jgi:glycerate kinase
MSPLTASRPARILIAPDSFKGSATAAAVASNIALGWSSVRGQDHIQLAPMAEGGEGTIDALKSVFICRSHARGTTRNCNGPR